RHPEILDHASNQHQLLVVLAAEDCCVGRNDAEELCDHRENAPEMPRPGASTEAVRTALGNHGYPRLAIRVHLPSRRREDEVHTGGLRQTKVPIEVTRIPIEVL